jgi:hypothetical protein
MKSSQNIQRLGHTKFTFSSDFVLKTLERASDLKMLISFPFFVCLSFLMSEHDLFRILSEWISVDIKIIGQVCLQGSELKKIIYLGFVPSGGHWAILC